MLRALAALALLVPAASAQDAPTDGKWEVVSMSRDGAADKSMVGAIRTQSGDGYTLVSKDAKQLTGKITFEAAKNTFEMRPSEGRYMGKVLNGIYKIEKDTLTLASPSPASPAPRTSPRPRASSSSCTRGQVNIGRRMLTQRRKGRKEDRETIKEEALALLRVLCAFAEPPLNPTSE
jgi:uncharacterized protein (TIGR03067 family)